MDESLAVGVDLVHESPHEFLKSRKPCHLVNSLVRSQSLLNLRNAVRPGSSCEVGLGDVVDDVLEFGTIKGYSLGTYLIFLLVVWYMSMHPKMFALINARSLGLI